MLTGALAVAAVVLALMFGLARVVVIKQRRLIRDLQQAVVTVQEARRADLGRAFTHTSTIRNRAEAASLKQLATITDLHLVAREHEWHHTCLPHLGHAPAGTGPAPIYDALADERGAA